MISTSLLIFKSSSHLYQDFSDRSERTGHNRLIVIFIFHGFIIIIIILLIWKLFTPASCEKQGCTKKYDELKLINHVQTSEILLIKILPTEYSLVKGIYI